MAPPSFSLAAILLFIILATLLSTVRGNGNDNGRETRRLLVGAVLPHSLFYIRPYHRILRSALAEFSRSKTEKFMFPSIYPEINYELVTLPLKPTPKEILDALCNKFLLQNVTAILYLSNSDVYGSNTASSQYLLQLTAYLGIPVIWWNADNSGLLQKASVLQFAPSIEHQAAAMLSILKRYNWHQFSIVTTEIAGFNEFIQTIKIQLDNPDFKFILLNTVCVDCEDIKCVNERLSELKKTETRVILLYSNVDEAAIIMESAAELELTKKDFVWIVTQSIIGNIEPDKAQIVPSSFPPGMLGVHFDISQKVLLQKQIEMAVKVFGHGLELFVRDHNNSNISLVPQVSCEDEGEAKWIQGQRFHAILKNVSIVGGEFPLEFNSDGTLKYAELEVMNMNEHQQWDKIGRWANGVLEITDIVWPGNSHVPPQGVPEKFHLKVVFLEEPPFVKLTEPNALSGKCIDRGTLCRMAKESELVGINITLAQRNSSYFMCCSGFSIDLLEILARDLGFTFELFRVEDGVWGREVNKKWNGLVSSLLSRRADLVMTAFKINAEREAAIDFTIPFMDTAVAIVVAKRTGIISPKAFLEPFDTISWLFILLISIQLAAISIFSFEWCSPSGYNCTTQPPRDHKFSLFRTYWLVWAILFGASVSVDCPRGYTARYMSSVWAMFAVVFLAIYTANLAAFMITKDEYYNLQGIDDQRLVNPYSMMPPLKFSTVPYGNTEYLLLKNYPAMYRYMKPLNRTTVIEGISGIKNGELDAFVYDATVLTHLVGQDVGCSLLTVGSWYAMSGYGIGFPKNSKYLNSFNRQLMMYKENGDLERLQKYWFPTGCKPSKKDRTSSNPLSLVQFTSAFLLLSLGIGLAFIILGLEHIYFRYLRKHLAKTDTGGCCALVSLVISFMNNLETLMQMF
ncbi:hypothetical protein CHUAL_002088 [Chamberlinius hualienensis]